MEKFLEDFKTSNISIKFETDSERNKIFEYFRGVGMEVVTTNLNPSGYCFWGLYSPIFSERCVIALDEGVTLENYFYKIYTFKEFERIVGLTLYKRNTKGELKEVPMTNLVFVKFKGNSKHYVFENPSNEWFDNDTLVLVDTCRGRQEGKVCNSIDVPTKAVRKLVSEFVGYNNTPLKKVISVCEIKKEWRKL